MPKSFFAFATDGDGEGTDLDGDDNDIVMDDGEGVIRATAAAPVVTIATDDGDDGDEDEVDELLAELGDNTGTDAAAFKSARLKRCAPVPLYSSSGTISIESSLLQTLHAVSFVPK